MYCVCQTGTRSQLAASSTLIGAGLVYAGATNTCGMTSLLAKMPWNQSSAKPPLAQRA